MTYDKHVPAEHVHRRHKLDLDVVQVALERTHPNGITPEALQTLRAALNAKQNFYYYATDSANRGLSAAQAAKDGRSERKVSDGSATRKVNVAIVRKRQ